jgi:SnoaL-like domain
VSTSLDAKLKDVQALLNAIVEETRTGQNEAPSHWELPILPPPDPEGQLSSTDLLNWWFRTPHGPAGDAERHEPVASRVDGAMVPEDARRARGSHDPAQELWSEISVILPEPEEHLAEEHAQAAVDCLYDFLHAIGQRDIDAAAALVHDQYHVIESGEAVDKPKFVNSLAFHFDALRNWDFDVSLAVAPEPVNHPNGVLIHALVQFDAVNLADGAKDGRVEERLAILREDESGAWKIAALPRIAR